MSEQNPYTIKSSEIVYDNPWIKVTEHQVINPAGNDGIYGIVHFKTEAIAIIPLDEDNNTWLVGQHRFPMEAYHWEVVEGGKPYEETPLETAKRELAEEVGLKATQYELILEMAMSNSTTDEVSKTYIARGLTEVGASPEETEVLQVKKLPFEEVYQMTMRGEITDALSVASILKAKIMLDAGQI